ncbi:MAG: hypothetical protein IT385_17935 [Deltaproteobacteria bacterium]|nr:hypothetical protein [Deltaproteobacteria bacterium]
MTSVVASLIVSATVVFAATGARAECSSVDSCQQALKCPGGFTLLKDPVLPNGWFCQQKTPAATVDPICKELNQNKDWVFDKGARDCTRTRDNGVVVHTKENLACPGGTTAVPPTGGPPVSCSRPEKTEFTPARLVKPGSAVGSFKTDDKASDALRMVACAVGGLKKTGDNWFCELHLKAPKADDPTCSKFGGHAWTWNAGKKACERKDGGATLTNTENVECRAPATYSAGSGKCVTPPGTYYDEPTLINP